LSITILSREFLMPGVQTIVNRLNTAFTTNIGTLAGRREAFAPGKPLTSEIFIEAGIVVDRERELINLFGDFIERVPGGFLEVFRSIVYYALSTSPPTQINFAWAPAFDFEITIWQVHDTAKTRGGITVLVKSSYTKE
jgi:hypothetical protein